MRWSILLLLLTRPLGAQDVTSRLFAVTDSGPYLTYSWGEHWQPLRGDLRGFEGEIHTFYCMGPSVFAGGERGLYRSDDFGETYHLVKGWPGGEVTLLLAARQYALEPTLFVGTPRGLYRSQDDGSEWVPVAVAEFSGELQALGWPGPQLFAGGAEGLFRSMDIGETWQRLDTGLPEAEILSIAHSRYFALDPIVFLGTKGRGLYRSEDGGESFALVGGRDWADRSLHALFWWGSTLLAGTNEGLFYSIDNGETWTLPKELAGIEVLAISVPAAEAETNSDVILGTGRGIFKSSDGLQSFRRVQEGMGEKRVTELSTFPIYPQSRERRRR